MDCSHSDCVKIMMKSGADSNLRDKQGKNALDLCTNLEISAVLQQYVRNSDSVEISSPIGEVTTYVVSDTADNDKSEKINIPLRCSLVSPVTEKSSLTAQLFPIYR